MLDLQDSQILHWPYKENSEKNIGIDEWGDIKKEWKVYVGLQTGRNCSQKRDCAKRSSSSSNSSDYRKDEEKRYELDFLKMKPLKAAEMPNDNLHGQTLKDAGWELKHEKEVGFGIVGRRHVSWSSSKMKRGKWTFFLFTSVFSFCPLKATKNKRKHS